MASPMPGFPARVDDQGSEATCTHHAVAKALTEALDDENIDVDQETLAHLLFSKSTARKVATDFDGKAFKVKDDRAKGYHWVTMTVFECTVDDFKTGWNMKKKGRFVLNWNHVNGLHCVFGVKWNKKKKMIHCFNSWGDANEPKPKIPPGDLNMIYRVSISLSSKKPTNATVLSSGESDEESDSDSGAGGLPSASQEQKSADEMKILCDAVCAQILEHHITDFDQVLAEALGIDRAYTEYQRGVPANTYKKLKVKELMKIWQATGEASVTSMLGVLDEMKVEEAGAMRKKVRKAIAGSQGKGRTGKLKPKKTTGLYGRALEGPSTGTPEEEVPELKAATDIMKFKDVLCKAMFNDTQDTDKELADELYLRSEYDHYLVNPRSPTSKMLQLKELVKMWKARNGDKATVEEMIAVLETMPQATNILDQLRKAVDKNGEEVESKKRKSQVSEGTRAKKKKTN